MDKKEGRYTTGNDVKRNKGKERGEKSHEKAKKESRYGRR